MAENKNHLPAHERSESLSVVSLCDPMDCSPPGSSVHEVFQARILERVAISFSMGSSQSRDQTQVSCIAGRFFTIWATREALLTRVFTIWAISKTHMGLLHVVSAMASHWRASTAKPAHSEGWLLMLETQTKLSGVEGAWLGLKFPPRGPLPVTACAFLLHGSWVSKGREQKIPEFFFFLIYWSIVALQCRVTFCSTTKWIIHTYTHIPSLVDLPPHPHCTPLGHHKARSWSPCSMLYSSFPLASYFTHGSGYMLDFPVVKNLPANGRDTRDAGSIPGLGRSPGRGLSCSKVCGFSQTRDWTCVFHIGKQILYHWATRKTLPRNFLCLGAEMSDCHFLHILLLEVEIGLYLWMAGVVCMYQKVMLFGAMFYFFYLNSNGSDGKESACNARDPGLIPG